MTTKKWKSVREQQDEEEDNPLPRRYSIVHEGGENAFSFFCDKSLQRKAFYFLLYTMPVNLTLGPSVNNVIRRFCDVTIFTWVFYDLVLKNKPMFKI